MPAILVECCFCDSTKDMNIYNAENIANAIFRGLVGEAIGSAKVTRTPGSLRILAITFIKPNTDQISEMTPQDLDRCYRITEGVYTLVDFNPEEEGHYYVELKSGLKGYISCDHSQLISN